MNIDVVDALVRGVAVDGVDEVNVVVDDSVDEEDDAAVDGDAVGGVEDGETVNEDVVKHCDDVSEGVFEDELITDFEDVNDVLTFDNFDGKPFVNGAFTAPEAPVVVYQDF